MITDADRKILSLAQRDNKGFHIATKWYLMGFEPLPYQYVWHYLTTPNCTWIGGIATAKTMGEAASCFIDCISTPYFKALNTSMTAKQAELPFEMILNWIEDNPKTEHLIEKITLKPYPIINFTNFSVYEFRTAGADARFIRGFEYDRANFDEAGLDPSGAIVKVLRGRLRGKRPNGRARLARLDCTTSPMLAVWLKERFDRGQDPAYREQYFSMRTATWDNTHLTAKQIEAMKSEYPTEMINVEMGGEFPHFGTGLFPLRHVEACINQSMYDTAYIALNPDDGSKPKRGYKLNEDPRHGVMLFELPYKPGKQYVMAGDPGSDNPPHRNSPCVIVADVTDRDHMRIVYFDWISGNGSVNPFLRSYKYALSKYKPALKGLDASGTQKYMDEIAFENFGIQTEKIDFGRDKDAMLNALAYDITNHNWSVPPIQGLKKQTATYDRDLDRNKRIPQDTVMTWAQVALLARYLQDSSDYTPPKAARFKGKRRRGSRPLDRAGMRNPPRIRERITDR